jgi:hypothetical protein
MRRSVLFIVAIWLCFGLTFYVKAQQSPAKSAQKQALPKFRAGIPYPEVRKKLMALGWQPVTLPTATPCGDDDRCRGFPEVYFCSGVGRAVCVYMWKKNTTLVRVYGVGENVGQVYDALIPCPPHPTQFDRECGGRGPDSAPTKSKPKIREVKQTINLATADGGNVVANDFIDNGVTVPDKSGNNPGQYILAEKKNFNVSYDPTYQAFHIGLSNRPIGRARLDMEQFMLRTLGLTKNQLCSLTYFVMTTSYISPKYGGNDLRFSFCLGATKLP